jgi:hypothetical protein
MVIACILLAGAAAAFALLWRIERFWFLAREAGCFCRRGRGGAVQLNPDGCPVHNPETWQREYEARWRADFARLMEKELGRAGAAPDVAGLPGTGVMRTDRRRGFFWRGRRN